MKNKTEINCCYNTKAMDFLVSYKTERARQYWRSYSVSTFSMQMKNKDIEIYYKLLEEVIKDGNDYMMFGVPLYGDTYKVWTLLILNGDYNKSWIGLNLFAPLFDKKIIKEVSEIAYAQNSNTTSPDDFTEEDSRIRMIVNSFKEKHFGSSPLSRIYHKLDEVNDRITGSWTEKEFAFIERSGCLRFFGDRIKDSFSFIEKGIPVAISVLSGKGDLYLDFENLRPTNGKVAKNNKNDQFITYELKFSKKGNTFILPTAELFEACGIDYKNYYYTYATVHVGRQYVFKPIVRKR